MPALDQQTRKVRVRVVPSNNSLLFTAPFRIGRAEECEVSIKDEYVSRTHAEVSFENGGWWIRDLNSSNGLFLDGHRVERAELIRPMTIRFGVEGPEVFFEPQAAIATDVVRSEPRSSEPILPLARNRSERGSGTILRRYVDHYFSKSAVDVPAGEHTMYVRRAFAEVQKQQKRQYGQVVAFVALLAVCAGGYALYERRQLQKQRALAEDLFYTMKSLDLDIANLEKAVAASGNQHDMQVVRQDSSRRREMQSTYDQYLAALHVYDRKMTEQQRIMLRIARIFGECELNMPSDFEAEVNKYIGYWQHSDRLAMAIRTAQQNGYAQTISRELLAQGLPPQFFYLALQESNFDPNISGPMTRKGIAKGMWQFVPETAIKYGLRVGPLVDLRRPDPGDERDQYEKATKAAALYLKDLYTTEAQASGFLVMACYNWGEDQVLPLVRSMPANPKERNFWRLLAHYRGRIPKETYDYVFYIVSAAVIGENPRLFGFDFDNPLADLKVETLALNKPFHETDASSDHTSSALNRDRATHSRYETIPEIEINEKIKKTTAVGTPEQHLTGTEGVCGCYNVAEGFDLTQRRTSSDQVATRAANLVGGSVCRRSGPAVGTVDASGECCPADLMYSISSSASSMVMDTFRGPEMSLANAP